LSQKEPRLSLGLLLSSAPQGDADTPDGAASTLHAVRSCGANFGGISGRMATPLMLDYLRTRGVSVFVWTLNEPEHLRSAIEAGVTGIISDYPERIPPLL
jgi:glycerophosphoryl diester phosphodiesterase